MGIYRRSLCIGCGIPRNPLYVAGVVAVELFRRFLSVNVPTLIIAVAIMILCTHSWGSCVSGNFSVGSFYQCSYDYSDCKGTLVYCNLDGTPIDCEGTKHEGNYYYVGLQPAPDGYCSANAARSCLGHWGYSCRPATCRATIRCTTQAEADSVYCALNPTAEGCVVEIDTTLFACTDNVSGNGGLYRLSCKAKNGVVTSCNGKTNVDIATDGTLVRPLHGTCAQNGFNTGIIGGATSDSTAPQSANADCFAIVGSTCHMKDKSSGNTFRCECDGSCNVALRNLMAGNADCTNPYEQPEQGDSLDLPLSSPSSSPSSSGSGEGSSPSSSPSGEGNSSDFEYDYTEILEAIQANTQQTATELAATNNWLNDIHNNTETANGLLQAIANKDWSPNINVSAPNVNVQGDTNIINVEVTGDTARAPAEINQFLRDTSGIGGYAEQFSDKESEWLARADSIKGAVSAFLDSMNVVDTSWAKHKTDIDTAIRETGNLYRAYMDTLKNSPFNDTIQQWTDKIVNNGVITGQGSNSCPSLLTRHHTLTIGNVSTDVGSLGGTLCEPIAGLGVTLWAVARTFLRFMVAFGCMVWIYLEVMGIDTTGKGDD